MNPIIYNTLKFMTKWRVIMKKQHILTYHPCKIFTFTLAGRMIQPPDPDSKKKIPQPSVTVLYRCL
jgi:hypothetical protein